MMPLRDADAVTLMPRAMLLARYVLPATLRFRQSFYHAADFLMPRHAAAMPLRYHYFFDMISLIDICRDAATLLPCR